MLEIKIQCESLEEARVYLNATNYLSLLQDLRANLRDRYKHGTDSDILKTIENFYPDIIQACDHSEGAY